MFSIATTGLSYAQFGLMPHPLAAFARCRVVPRNQVGHGNAPIEVRPVRTQPRGFREGSSGRIVTLGNPRSAAIAGAGRGRRRQRGGGRGGGGGGVVRGRPSGTPYKRPLRAAVAADGAFPRHLGA